MIWFRFLYIYRLLDIQINDPLQCQGFPPRSIAKYLCFGKELPHEYWVTSASETSWFPIRLNIFRCGVIKNSGLRCVMLLYWRSSLASLINVTPSKDVNELIALESKWSVITVLAMSFNPKGVLLNPLWFIATYSIFLRPTKFCVSFPFKSVERLSSKDVKECPICCKDGSWCNIVWANFNFSNTKRPLNAAGWTYFTGFFRHENTYNVGWCKKVFE